jgi:hypothetical protein
MTVFVDTAYYVARIDRRDQWHQRAVAAARPGLSYLTSSLVVNETISLLQARGLLSAALEFLAHVRSHPRIEIVYPDPAVQSEGWDLFVKYGGGGANAVDCVSFAIMKRRSIRKAFTFDAHFRASGFEIL